MGRLLSTYMYAKKGLKQLVSNRLVEISDFLAMPEFLFVWN
jgi:hypothetical protein